MDWIFDPVFQEDQNNNEASMTNKLIYSINGLDKKSSYPLVLSTLWNTGMPCSNLEENNSVLKYCEWKGKQVPCAAIFSTYPTDQGMCCTFNMKAANELFSGETYPAMIETLQNMEKLTEFLKTHLELKTEPGMNKGLLVVLDSHSDILSASSIDEDKHGFVGLITQGGKFPQINAGGFDIKPGHKNVVGLTATMISADDALQNMNPKSHYCSFQSDSISLKIFKNYTQSNCIFECNFYYAQKQLEQPCTPWYFPSPDMSPNICDPWQAAQLVEKMSNVLINQCNHCLPDCDSTIFKARISSAPLQKCQLNSLGSSKFCNLNNDIWFSSEVLSNWVGTDFQKRFYTEPYFMRKTLPTSQRKIGSSLIHGDIFVTTNKPYNAFDNDIAVVQIFFESAYVTKIERSPRMSWIDYCSNIGGIFGLVLGMGIISVFELLWVAVRYILVLRSLYRSTKISSVR
jgi:hypothetical protein